MSIFKLPTEVLQQIIDLICFDTESETLVELRLTCRAFDVVMQDAVFQLPRSTLFKQKMGKPMVAKLIQSFMGRRSAEEYFLFRTINDAVEFLVKGGYIEDDLRSRCTKSLTEAAAESMFYWRVIESIFDKTQPSIPFSDTKANAFLAAIRMRELNAVEALLDTGVMASTNTSFFGEALATAVRSGSPEMVQLLLHHWKGDDSTDYLSASRHIHAIEAAAATNNKPLLDKLLDWKTPRLKVLYDDVIFRMIRLHRDKMVDYLLDRREPNDMSLDAEKEFWLRLIRTAAISNSEQCLLNLSSRCLTIVGEASFSIAIEDACRLGQDKIADILLSALPSYDPTHDTGALFWTAWHGSIDLLGKLLALCQSGRQAISKALAGAISGKQPTVVAHLLSTAGVDIRDQEVPTRFTDAIRLITPEAFTKECDSSPDPQYKNPIAQEACVAGDLSAVIAIIHSFRNVQPPPEQPGWDYFGIVSNEAVVHNHPDILTYLCENRPPHLPTTSAKTAYMLRIFMDFGWNANAFAMGDRSPDLSLFVGDEYLLQWLLDNGGSATAIGEWNNTATSQAVLTESMSTIRLLLERSDGVHNGELHHFAVCRESYDTLGVIELLLDLGCPIDSTMYQEHPMSWMLCGKYLGSTVLYTAASNGEANIVVYLLYRGANQSITSSTGRTPLEVAEAKSHTDIVQILSR